MKITDIPRPTQELLRQMQRLRFGEIRNLIVKDGRPFLAPPPTVVRQIKFGSDCGPRPEAQLDDFELCASMAEFVTTLERIGEGLISHIEVKDGLPFRMSVEE